MICKKETLLTLVFILRCVNIFNVNINIFRVWLKVAYLQIINVASQMPIIKDYFKKNNSRLLIGLIITQALDAFDVPGCKKIIVSNLLQYVTSKICLAIIRYKQYGILHICFKHFHGYIGQDIQCCRYQIQNLHSRKGNKLIFIWLVATRYRQLFVCTDLYRQTRTKSPCISYQFMYDNVH